MLCVALSTAIIASLSKEGDTHKLSEGVSVGFATVPPFF